MDQALRCTQKELKFWWHFSENH